MTLKVIPAQKSLFVEGNFFFTHCVTYTMTRPLSFFFFRLTEGQKADAMAVITTGDLELHSVNFTETDIKTVLGPLECAGEIAFIYDSFYSVSYFAAKSTSACKESAF